MKILLYIFSYAKEIIEQIQTIMTLYKYYIKTGQVPKRSILKHFMIWFKLFHARGKINILHLYNYTKFVIKYVCLLMV